MLRFWTYCIYTMTKRPVVKKGHLIYGAAVLMSMRYVLPLSLGPLTFFQRSSYSARIWPLVDLTHNH